jgi:excisionase family DNA binding protein
MNFEFEAKDIELIAKRVAEVLQPLLLSIRPRENEDHLFDVKGLSQYLQVNPSWIYKQVSLKAIPYFKSGKYVKFRKATIDKWIDTKTIRPIPFEKAKNKG